MANHHHISSLRGCSACGRSTKSSCKPQILQMTTRFLSRAFQKILTTGSLSRKRMKTALHIECGSIPVHKSRWPLACTLRSSQSGGDKLAAHLTFHDHGHTKNSPGLTFPDLSASAELAGKNRVWCLFWTTRNVSLGMGSTVSCEIHPVRSMIWPELYNWPTVDQTAEALWKTTAFCNTAVQLSWLQKLPGNNHVCKKDKKPGGTQGHLLCFFEHITSRGCDKPLPAF